MRSTSPSSQAFEGACRVLLCRAVQGTVWRGTGVVLTMRTYVPPRNGDGFLQGYCRGIGEAIHGVGHDRVLRCGGSLG